MSSHYTELMMAITQFFTRSGFVKVTKWGSNWAQAEEEVYNEQSEVIQTFSVFSDNLVSVDSFMEIWPHVFFQMNNPKPLNVENSWNRKFKIYWSRWIKIKGLTEDTSYSSQPTMIVEWILFCCDSSNFQHLSEIQWILCCLFWTPVKVSFLSSALRFGFYPVACLF